MKPRKSISAYVLLVGVMGLSIVGGILAFQIFSAATKNQATPEQKTATKPIDGNINKDVVNNLKQRTVISENSLIQLVLTTPTLTPTPTLTLTPTQTQVATEAATLRQ